MSDEFSDYVVYVDESGDHGLKSIDPQYPIFSLAFCIFKKDEYINKIAPALNALKCKYWGHCDVVFHEHVLRPEQDNQAFKIIEKKFIKHNNGDYKGKGLKEFP